MFLLNNVNDNAPTIFQTRWAFSFLRGPLSRPEISSLMQSKKNATQTSVAPNARNAPDNSTPVASAQTSNAVASKSSGPPIVPSGIDVRYFVPSKAFRASNRLEYRPALFANASIHFVRAAGDIDSWSDLQILARIGDQVTEHLWDDSQRLEPKSFEFSDPERDFVFADPPAELLQIKNYKAWERELAEYLFRHEKCIYYQCKALKQNTTPGLSELDARMELHQLAREARDKEMEKLRAKYEDKLRTLQSKVTVAQQRVDKLVDEAKAKRMDGLVNLGTSIFGALLGNKSRSGSRTSSAVRDLTNAANKGSDISRAQDTLDELVLQKNEMERECMADIERVKRDFSVENLVLEPVEVPLRKADTKIKNLALAWVPWQIDSQGNETCLIETL